MAGRTPFVVLVAFGVGMATGWLVRPESAVEPQSITLRKEIPQEKTPITAQAPERTVRSEGPPAVTSTPNVAPEVPPSSHTTNRAPTGDPNTIFQTGRDSGLVVAEASSMQRLLEAVRINCDFGSGYGAQWKDGRAAMLSASWQGGPIMYDQIALSEGIAMMVGSEGATGSNTGEVKVRVAATKTGLHFSGFVPRGDLISTTVFTALDDKQRFMAVMSIHATAFSHNSSQFHGTCDVLY